MSLAPVIVTITPDTSAFVAALEEAKRAMAAFGRAIRGRWHTDVLPHRNRDLLPSTERPVDRARRLRLERELRILARRADRRRRIAARKAATT